MVGAEVVDMCGSAACLGNDVQRIVTFIISVLSLNMGVASDCGKRIFEGFCGKLSRMH